MSKDIHVNVWERIENNENENIMSFSYSSCPSYNTGDTLFLERVISHDVPVEISQNNSEMRLTQYVILDILHSVRQWFVGNTPNKEDPFPFKIINYLSMDIYVAEVKE